MSTTTTQPTTMAFSSPVRTVARWMVSFAGFPLGGLAAMLVIGPVDTVTSALAGGFLTGLILGAVQAWAMRAGRRLGMFWVIATGAGLAAGLAIGAVSVGFATGLADLALQGAICGALVGAAQAVALLAARLPFRRADRPGSIGPRLLVALWPLYLSAAWTVGWLVTTAIGVRVDEQFTAFGSAGAITVAALTSVLPLVLRRRLVDSGREAA